MTSSNAQVSMWRGDFGGAYTDRNFGSPETMRALGPEHLEIHQGPN
jgi:hypothetical protein